MNAYGTPSLRTPSRQLRRRTSSAPRCSAAELNDELPSVASLAKAYCSEAYFHAAAENIQIHGGIGFTWEHDAHLYLRRALTLSALTGDGADPLAAAPQ